MTDIAPTQPSDMAVVLHTVASKALSALVGAVSSIATAKLYSKYVFDHESTTEELVSMLASLSEAYK